ncbi:hypothetical protein [Cellulomonas sp. KRMCY2]|uniref:hypothetical protein n=1 Tax=Cellulomonas sp. KRMCY2 TaxID=1304865 RepID=UPI00045E8198|nr:hypothetical protein [Cellulomonas sp. KRMCY2]
MGLQVGSAVRTPRKGAAVVVGIATVVGLLGILAGIVVAIAAGAGTSGSAATVPVVSADPEAMSDAASAVVHGTGMPGRAPVYLTRQGTLMLSVYENVSAPTRVLAQADVAASAIAAGVAVLLLVPVLRSTACREPFAQGNPPRLALAAGAIFLGWAAASVLPVIAASIVVRSVPAEAGGWEPVLRPDYWPLGFVALLATLAFATWHGRRLVADTEGLV